MTLGECVKEYREYHRLSQRQFAEMCELSNAYISILEKNLNPKTGEAPVPTVGVYKKIANAMGISTESLMEKANESSVSLGFRMTFDTPAMPFHPQVIEILDKSIEESKNANEKELLSLFFTMTDYDKEKLLDYARYIVDSYKRPGKRRTK